MPFYEYQCKHCGFEDTLLESMNAAASKKCPSCGKARAFVRLISAAGFQLKGQGWYATDFKDKPQPKAKDKDAGGADDSKSSDKADDKAASKAADTASDSKSSDGKKESASADKKPAAKKSAKK